MQTCNRHHYYYYHHIYLRQNTVCIAFLNYKYKWSNSIYFGAILWCVLCPPLCIWACVRWFLVMGVLIFLVLNNWIYSLAWKLMLYSWPIAYIFLRLDRKAQNFVIARFPHQLHFSPNIICFNDLNQSHRRFWFKVCHEWVVNYMHIILFSSHSLTCFIKSL